MPYDTQLLIVRKSGEPDDRLPALCNALGINYRLEMAPAGSKGSDVIPRHRFDERRGFLTPLVELLQRHGLAINVQSDGRDWLGFTLDTSQENFDAKMADVIAEAPRLGFYKDQPDIRSIEPVKPEGPHISPASGGRVVA